MVNFETLLYWIRERHQIYLAKESGKPAPWTADTTLQNYRFCNVYRELDTVTKWVDDNWRTPHKDDPDLWFAMVVARLINQPTSLAALGCPIPWQKSHFLEVLGGLKRAGIRVFNGCYIVSTNGRSMDKLEYLAKYVLDPLWNNRELIRPIGDRTLQSFFEVITKFDGIGSFIGGQVIADLKYVSPLSNAPDWDTFAVPGPGSLKGMRYVYGFAMDDTSQDKLWKRHLLELKEVVSLRCPDMPKIHAQDLQNCLCETSKYAKVLLGAGTPKQLYRGGV